jgi:hypothetical protein
LVDALEQIRHGRSLRISKRPLALDAGSFGAVAPHSLGNGHRSIAQWGTAAFAFRNNGLGAGILAASAPAKYRAAKRAIRSRLCCDAFELLMTCNM